MLGRVIRIRGQVQGVGFRPFVWSLAKALDLRGRVLNDAEGVLIYAFGDCLEIFEKRLADEAPDLAKVDSVEGAPYRFSRPPQDFVIDVSGGLGARTRVTPDAATCSACLDEIHDPDTRRFGYPFTNCTNCGPRLSILHAIPYDRAHTTMAVFDMCQDCSVEYQDPSDRRFHAQPIACSACGPKLWLETDAGTVADNVISVAIDSLRNGAILAIKGIGGFHIGCDATNEEVIAELRRRKRRPGKPFALMGSREMVGRHSLVSEAEDALLRDVAAPVVLLERAGEALPEALAPGLSALGWMLPYTPLHHLLVDGFGKPLVMTSGNLSGEPQVTDNLAARQMLGGIVDGFLVHDREIARRLDDGVERITPHGPMVLRRARGRVPNTLPSPPGFGDVPQVAAYGGQLKSTICFLKDGQALLSQHIGDLDNATAWDEFRKADSDFRRLFELTPKVIASDLHPDYLSSTYALQVATGADEHFKIQHHHAHLAACLFENEWPLDGGPVAGIILDGLGLGTDGTIWGGELLVGDYRKFGRVGHLASAPLIGGDAAQREPWRNLLARLDQAELGRFADESLGRFPLALARQAVRAGINTPLSSSAGRLFDAVAAALGVAADGQSYEGEAAMRLEGLATRAPQALDTPYPFSTIDGVIDPRPMFRALARDVVNEVTAETVAARFHSGLAAAFSAAASALVASGAARAVVLSGGCFQNALLLDLCMKALNGQKVMIHRKVPANDGSLALGQAAIAAALYLASKSGGISVACE